MSNKAPKPPAEPKERTNSQKFARLDKINRTIVLLQNEATQIKKDLADAIAV